MPKWIIDKSFSFCYGHRVHNQRLDTRFTESGDACLACRHLHGHEGLVKVFLRGTDDNKNVKETGMVQDFKHLGWFKNFLDDTLDHKFIMDLKDPLINFEFNEMTDHEGNFDTKFLHELDEGHFIPNLTFIKNLVDNWDCSPAQRSAVFEKYEGVVFVDFVPTSENIAGWLLKVCQEKMKDLSGVEVNAVEYWETPKSHCRVEA